MTGGLLLFGAGILLLVIAFHRSWADVWNVLVTPTGNVTPKPSAGTGPKG
jgi:hypothetical protein